MPTEGFGGPKKKWSRLPVQALRVVECTHGSVGRLAISMTTLNLVMSSVLSTWWSTQAPDVPTWALVRVRIPATTLALPYREKGCEYARNSKSNN
eukprot:3488990-Prymnesium_polylepis.1